MKKAERLLNIVLLLRTGSSYSVQELAREFDVSIRTVYRDLSDITPHVPVYYDEGYRLLVNRTKTVTQFTEDELREIKRVIVTAAENSAVDRNSLLAVISEKINRMLEGGR